MSQGCHLWAVSSAAAAASATLAVRGPGALVATLKRLFPQGWKGAMNN